VKLIDTLETGDVVFTSCSAALLCYHIGIVCEINGVKKVFHNDPKIKNKWGGNVCSELWDDFMKGSHLHKVVRTNTTKERILEVSRKHKAETWDEFLFNCEDYILEITEGHRRSNQRDGFKVALLGLIILFLI
jgi:hypothetical protein